MSDPPAINDDFIDMLLALQENDVAFVIVGAYALAAHGFPRATGDIAILVQPTAENALKVHRALLAFGALIKNKSATGRTNDLADVEQLRQLPSR